MTKRETINPQLVQDLIGNTPIDKIKLILWKYTQDFAWIGEVPEDVVLKNADRMLRHFEGLPYPPESYNFYNDLKVASDEYLEDLLLNKSV